MSRLGLTRLGRPWPVGRPARPCLFVQQAVMWRAAARETEQECGPVSHLASSKKKKTVLRDSRRGRWQSSQTRRRLTTGRYSRQKTPSSARLFFNLVHMNPHIISAPPVNPRLYLNFSLSFFKRRLCAD